MLGTLEGLEQSLVDEGLTQALTGESARALRIADDLASFGAELPATKLRILVWIMEGKLDQARDRIESALAENPEAVGLQAMRVLVHDASGNYQEFRLAVHELDLANLKYAQPEDYVFLAKSAQGADFARKMAAKAFETCRSPFSMLLRGRTEADYANETGNTQKRDQIVKDIDSAAHLMPSAPAVRIERLASYLLLANACRANGDEESYKRYLQAASDAADSIAQQRKPFAWELMYLAEFYYERGEDGDIDQAAACYRQVMEGSTRRGIEVF